MTDGTRKGKPVYCPINAWNEKDCPYARNGLCCLENAPEDCDDFHIFFSDWEDWEES